MGEILSKLKSDPLVDHLEIQEWVESLADLKARYGAETAGLILAYLQETAFKEGINMPFTANTPYINTIAADKQPVFPGDRELERRIKNAVRWNAMAMVVRANRDHASPGGHISTFASSATLYEIGYNHFFRAPKRADGYAGDLVYYQGHAAPGMYARAFVEGRLSEEHLLNFRRELKDKPGLSSYPHPWLMPDFWQFPTVSMGLGPIASIYQARFMRYLEHRGLKKAGDEKVWSFVGDGESDEPETLGAINLAVREKLNNLIWVVNCNLQRLDGPVRGNGKIIQELERIFRGAGWNVIKVVWGGEWDPILAADDGELVARMGEVVDGQYQKYTVADGAYVREHFFNSPRLQQLVSHLSDEQIHKIKRGGHDPEKVYAAYAEAMASTDRPTVILAKTVKGYGLGEAGEGRNVTHNNKKMNEEQLKEFRTRFSIPVSDEKVAAVPFYRPAEDSPEMKYLKSRREALGGPVPQRLPMADRLSTPELSEFKEFFAGSKGRELSTTMAFNQVLTKLLRNKDIGKFIVPIIPDEARTFGLDTLFSQFGIYASQGQLYDPVDADNVAYYREASDGQILEEGINEAGSMASFVAAGTAYSTYGVNAIPFYIYYSMFGFQRVGDQIWLAADSRAKGFLLGATAGRTTLNGEGLQHEDGHSLLAASAVPNLLAYDPAYAFEIAVIVQDGLKRMYADDEQVFYYITLENENYEHLPMPEGAEEGIRRGLYKFSSVKASGEKARVNLFGSGAIFKEALRAAKILAERYQVGSDVWSVTSYKTLRFEALEAERWNRLNPAAPPKGSYLHSVAKELKDPVIASSDYVRLVSEQVKPWIADFTALGTDGFGRSEGREELRRFFEVDAENIVLEALRSLQRLGKVDAKAVAKAVVDLGLDGPRKDPLKD
ncbi:MAG TPA: pyruvate dehydrogenase (acetyl-transferring), homodimeric type [bacterium]|jgi:pyruvate dehydrogenase E1 component|nr:pyruvate dehydrogenase (acetyl-transferring), homodimeric type [bacterium]